MNYGKDDVDYGFKSDHIFTSHRLHALSMLFNRMVVHGHTPTDLLKSTIVSIPKNNKAHIYIYTISLKNNKAAGIDDVLVEQLKKATNDIAYKRWTCHSGRRLLCKLC